MSKVWFGSDFHIGHTNIHKFRCVKNGFPIDFTSEFEHREWLYDFINDNIKKRDVLYLLGDIVFTEEALLSFKKFPFRKVLIKGNHDLIKHQEYTRVFDQIHGLTRYKGDWLSHAPIHPAELRGRKCLHGHVHNQTLPDPNYINCCVEELMKVYKKPCVTYGELV